MTAWIITALLIVAVSAVAVHLPTVVRRAAERATADERSYGAEDHR